MTRFAISGLLLAAFAMAGAGAQETKKDGQSTEPKAEPKAEPKPEPKKVYRNVSAEKLEGILKEMKIDFERGKSKDEGVAVYTFEKVNRPIRLQNFGGKDLWIDTEYTDKLTPELVNEWNVRAKFSRAVRLKGDKGVVSLESQLDCVGGVTDPIIRQFLARFEGEIQQFNKFSKKLVDVRLDDRTREIEVRKEVR